MKITIDDHSPAWVSLFETEKNKIQTALAKLSPAIEHIGSTSVQGLGAKPVIDILVGIGSERELNLVIEPMIGAGYTYMKKYDAVMPYRRYFPKFISSAGNPIPKIIDVDDLGPTEQKLISLVHVHILVKGTEHWIRHIAFRDYLRAHSQIKEAYHQLKKELSKQEWRDGMEYNDAKNEFIKKVEKDAVKWYVTRSI